MYLPRLRDLHWSSELRLEVGDSKLACVYEVERALSAFLAGSLFLVKSLGIFLRDPHLERSSLLCMLLLVATFLCFGIFKSRTAENIGTSLGYVHYRTRFFRSTFKVYDLFVTNVLS
jgi:hypothetical protein